MAVPESLLDKARYYKKTSFEEAWEKLFDYMANPSFSPVRKTLHDTMLVECVRRDPAAIKYVKAMIRTFLQAHQLKVEDYTEDQAVEALYQDMYGLGAIEPLVDDPEVQEISVNGINNIWYEKNGKTTRAEGISFKSEAKLMLVIDRCMNYTQKEINRREAVMQTTMADGARIYIAIPPVAKVPYINYRKFSVFEPSEEAYIKTKTVTFEALEVLKAFPKYRVNQLIIGPQNSGKTTLLSFLAGYYPEYFRVGVLEADEFETNIDNLKPNSNVFALRTDKATGVDEEDIFFHALRFSADILLMPEARGAEIEEVIKVNRRGNDGTIATIHSTSPYEVVDDISLMFTESGKNYQPHLLKRMIAKGLDIVVTTHHFPDGARKVINIAEIDYDDDKEKVWVNELFIWENEQLTRTTTYLSDRLLNKMIFHGAKAEELKRLGLMRG